MLNSRTDSQHCIKEWWPIRSNGKALIGEGDRGLSTVFSGDIYAMAEHSLSVSTL